MPKHCIFCNATRLTQEDIWPDWYKRWLKRQGLSSTFHSIYFEGDETTTLATDSSTVGGKRRIMCEPCNQRLGRLQNAASTIMKPMLNHPFVAPQEPILLTPSDQAVLAAWTAMTAMTAEFLPEPMPDVDETFFTQVERVEFRRTRKPLREMNITSTQYVGQNATGAYFAHSRPAILDFDTGKHTGAFAKLFIITINLFHVCFQLAFYRTPDMRYARGEKSLLGIGANPPDLIVPLWPPTMEQEWPAKHSIGDDTLLLFCQRWNP